MRQFTLAALILLAASFLLAADKPVATLQLPCESRYQDLSPSGNQLAVHCKGGALHLLELPGGVEQRVFPPDQHSHTTVYSQDGNWLAFGFEDGTVEVVSANGNGAPKRWKPSSRRIDVLNFFPDSKSIVVGPLGSSAEVWDIAGAPTLRAQLPFAFGGLSDSAISPDGKVLVLAGDDTVLRWYDTVSWKLLKQNKDFLLETFSVSFTPDGKQVVAGGADSRISVLDAATAKLLRQTPPEPAAYVGGLLVVGNRVASLYYDAAGEKPPHVLIWELADFNSPPAANTQLLTCGNRVHDKLWVCYTDGQTLTVSQYE